MTSIFIESKNLNTPEANFIKTYINHKFPKLIPFEIVPLNGWQGLWKTNKLMENRDLGNNNVVIFDADTADNNGGFELRKQAIEKIKQEQNIDFNLFLFPDNSSDGDFELLLENIINQNHSSLLKCFNKYEQCIKTLNAKNNSEYKLPIRKSKIYAYIDAFPKSRNKRERFKSGDWFFENNEYWNLDADYLNSLKSFFEILK